MLSLAGSVSIVPSRDSYSQIPIRPLSFLEVAYYGLPHRSMSFQMKRWKWRNFRNLFRGLWRVAAAQTLGIPHFYGQLCIAVKNPNEPRLDYGLVSLRVITTEGAGLVASTFAGSAATSLSNFKYHAVGVGGDAESVSDSGLGSELVNYYSTANVRTAGTVSILNSTTYRVFGNVALTTATSVREHGLFSQQNALTGSPAGGYLLDRSLISAIPVLAGASVECDYRLVVATGA